MKYVADFRQSILEDPSSVHLDDLDQPLPDQPQDQPLPDQPHDQPADQPINEPHDQPLEDSDQSNAELGPLQNEHLAADQRPNGNMMTMMEPQKKTAKQRENFLVKKVWNLKEPRVLRKRETKLQEKQIKNLPEAEAARTKSPKKKNRLPQL